MIIRPVGGQLFRAERRTDRRSDMTKLKVSFRNFANAPRNVKKLFGNHLESYYADCRAVMWTSPQLSTQIILCTVRFYYFITPFLE